MCTANKPAALNQYEVDPDPWRISSRVCLRRLASKIPVLISSHGIKNKSSTIGACLSPVDLTRITNCKMAKVLSSGLAESRPTPIRILKYFMLKRNRFRNFNAICCGCILYCSIQTNDTDNFMERPLIDAFGVLHSCSVANLSEVKARLFGLPKIGFRPRPKIKCLLDTLHGQKES